MHTLHTVLTVWRLGHTPGGSGHRTPPSTPSPAASSAVYPASAASVWSSAMMNMPPSPPHPKKMQSKKIYQKINGFISTFKTLKTQKTPIFFSTLAVFTVCVG